MGQWPPILSHLLFRNARHIRRRGKASLRRATSNELRSAPDLNSGQPRIDSRLRRCERSCALARSRRGDQSVARRIGRTITNDASLVEQHWPAICRVAKALMSDRVLSEAEIDELIAS